MSHRLRFARTPTGIAGLGVLGFVVCVAALGPLFAPHDPNLPIEPPLSGPSSSALLGTDDLGRDVLSRLLYGGRSVILLALAATLLAYACGLLIGLSAGWSRGLLDPSLMRSIDVLLVFPPLLFMLILITATGPSTAVLVLGVGVIQAPPISRLVRTATMETSVRGYVEAAVARGETTTAILGREIFPNILPPILVDAGLRFTYSILIVASVNYLGLGLQPPSSDWSLMISENREYISINSLSVLAPAAMIALLTIGVNLIGDAVARSLGRSYVSRRVT
ncbi:MAG: ABC transporter permease [Solirubrobacteraceae bacterium]